MRSCLSAVGTAGVLLFATVASAAETFTADISRTGGESAVAPGGSFTYEIMGTLTNNDGNRGLAFFSLDLQLNKVSGTGPDSIDLGPNLSQSGGPDVGRFVRPMGYSVDFDGTAIDGKRVQAGGGQNTILNCIDPNPCIDPTSGTGDAFPSGDVMLDLGHTALVLFTGEVTIPDDAGIGDGAQYELSIVPDSLHANLIASFSPSPLSYDVEPVDNSATGTSVTVEVGSSDPVAGPPRLLHMGDSQYTVGPYTTPCSGYIDPRRESTNGSTVTEGLQSLTLVFSEPVRNVGGAPLSAAAFSVVTTGGTPQTVSDIVPAIVPDPGDGSQRQQVIVNLSGLPPTNEWTSIIANVEDMAGNPIGDSPNSGDLGVGMAEDDRVDFGFLPCDLTQDGAVSAFDLVRTKQVQLGTCTACPGFVCGEVFDDVAVPFYFDFDRNDFLTSFDLVRFTQYLRGTGGLTTREWLGQVMNNTQP